MQKKLVLISPTSQRLVELFGLEKSILGADLTIRKNPNSILGKVQLEIIRDYMHYM